MNIELFRENLIERGFAIVEAMADPNQLSLLQTESQVLTENPTGYGVRNLLVRSSAVATFASSSSVMELMRELIGASARCVRGILFDKNPKANWKVPWHQDTTIAVREKIETPGYGPWSVKEGVPHVRPPAEVLAQMLTLRLHLDPCGDDNGPLRVLSGSHREGILDETAMNRWKVKPSEVCVCGAGDVLLFKPLLLHASSEALRPVHRRVVHLEYASTSLEGRLEWAS